MSLTFFWNIGTFFYYADRLHSYIIPLPHKNNIAWGYILKAVINSQMKVLCDKNVIF